MAQLLIEQVTNTMYVSGASGIAMTPGNAIPVSGNPSGSYAGIEGNMLLDVESGTLYYCSKTGDPGVSEFQPTGPIYVFDSIDTLRSYSGPISIGFVKSYYASGSTGAGIFEIGATSSDNGGTQINDILGRTWYRQPQTDQYNWDNFGAKGDVKYIASTSISISSGSAVLTVSGASFVSGDIGKSIQVPGAGISGYDLGTTILSVQSSEQITLAASGTTTVSGASGTVTYGTDDTSSINACEETAYYAGNLGTYQRDTATYGVTSRINILNDHNFRNGAVQALGNFGGGNYIAADYFVPVSSNVYGNYKFWTPGLFLGNGTNAHPTNQAKGVLLISPNGGLLLGVRCENLHSFGSQFVGAKNYRLIGCKAYNIFGNGATFTASVSGTNLVVSAVATGVITVGAVINATGIPYSNFVQIVSGPTSGGVGTYVISSNLGTIASESMQCGEIGADGFDVFDACDQIGFDWCVADTYMRDGWKISFSGGGTNTNITLRDCMAQNAYGYLTLSLSEENSGYYNENGEFMRFERCRAFRIYQARSDQSAIACMGLLYSGTSGSTTYTSSTFVDQCDIEVGDFANNIAGGYAYYAAGVPVTGQPLRSIYVRKSIARSANIASNINAGLAVIELDIDAQSCATPATGSYGIFNFYEGTWPTNTRYPSKLIAKFNCDINCAVTTPADGQAHIFFSQPFRVQEIIYNNCGTPEVPLTSYQAYPCTQRSPSDSTAVQSTATVTSSHMSGSAYDSAVGAVAALTIYSRGNHWHLPGIPFQPNQADTYVIKSTDDVFDGVILDFYNPSTASALYFETTNADWINSAGFYTTGGLINFAGLLQIRVLGGRVNTSSASFITDNYTTTLAGSFFQIIGATYHAATPASSAINGGAAGGDNSPIPSYSNGLITNIALANLGTTDTGSTYLAAA